MKKSSIKALKAVERQLKTAVKADYISNVPRGKVESAIAAYEDETGNSVKISNYNCAACVLNAFKQVGKWALDQPEFNENETR